MPGSDEDSRHSLPEIQARVTLMEDRLSQLLDVVSAQNERAERTEALVENIAKALEASATRQQEHDRTLDRTAKANESTSKIVQQPR